MDKYREILRLHSGGMSMRSIAVSCNCSRNTVSKAISRADELGLDYERLDDILEKDLAELLFPNEGKMTRFRLPDYKYIHNEMAKSGVTLKLLWHEYCESCSDTDDAPYMYTQFRTYYKEWAVRTKATMRIEHKPGEKLEVDWAGTKMSLKDNVTGGSIPINVSHARLYGHPGQYRTIVDHMPPNHQKYVEWNGDRFRHWAASIGPNTETVVCNLLDSLKIEQQGYRSCMGLLKLADKYSALRLEAACKRALSYTTNPGYRNVQTVLKNGSDKLDAANSSPSTNEHAFTRGAEYYGRKGK